MTQSTFAISGLAARLFAILCLVLLAAPLQADISRFVGKYSGSADVIAADGTPTPRDMSVEISETGKGFQVSWTSVTHRVDGTSKEKTYSINFVPSDRDGVFSAAMARNVFGHSVQMDPMKGEPYVWARIIGDTLSVYSLYVDSVGGYEIQQFNRTLAPGGLDLEFVSLRNGERQRSVSTFLKRH